MLQNWLKTFFHVLLETLPLFGLIFIINPILIALAPREPFDYQFSFVILGVVCICACLFTALPISFFSNKYRQIAIAFLRSLFLVFFVISIYYPEGARRLDGVTATDSSLLYYCVLYFSYIISLSVLMLLFLRSKVILRNLYVSFAILGFAFVIYYPIQHWMTSETQIYYSDKTDLTFASDRNIIVILADMLQGSTIEQYFTMHPNEKNNFQGFTLFSRATSPFPFTTYAAPAIFTGNIYNSGPDNSSINARKEAETSSFITDAVNSNFDDIVIGLDIVKLHPTQFSFQSSNPLGTAITLFALSLQRIIKIPLDALVSVHTLLGLAPGENPTMWLVGYKKNSKDIMDRLATAPIGKSKNKVLFFHNMIPHAPIVFKRKDLESMPIFLEPLELTVENYWEEMGFFLGQVNHLLDHMKHIGIYDRSLIIIVGDHGHFIGGQDKLYDYPGAEDFEGTQKGSWARAAAMYNPGILIKPPLKRGSLQISRVASSILGLRSLIKQYLASEDLDLSKDFETLGKSKVIVFKDKISSNPYDVSDDHVVLEFIGNVSSLAQRFAKDTWKGRDLSYKVGTKTTDVTKYLDGYWIKEKENGGAWLQGKPATLILHTSGVEKKIYKLLMVFSGLINERHPEQRVRVWLNGNELGMASITTPGKNTVELDIPMNLLVNDGVNEFKFEPLDAISPLEIGAWSTPSPISVFLYSMQLLESEENHSMKLMLVK